DNSITYLDKKLEEPGFFQRLNAQVVQDGVLGGIAGGFGIVKGAVFGAATGVVKIISHEVSEWLNSLSAEKESIYACNLDYLKEIDFSENKNCDKDTSEILKNLYNQALIYQKLKDTRPFRRSRKEDVIDDGKYLLNILIGRR